MTARLLLAAVALAAAPAAGVAQQLPKPDPEPRTPYPWRVVLQVRPHPLLTPAFRQQLRRDLFAALQTGAGPLANLEVFDLAETPRDRWDPLWQQFDDKGWSALDVDRELTGVKTHLLRVEIRDGTFHLEARQHDGFSGLSTPVVQRQSTRAAELVGRIAGLMIDRDFGLAGTVEPVPGRADEADVRFRGGDLGGPVERYAAAGDVMAVAVVRRSSRPAGPVARTATGRVAAGGPEGGPVYVGMERKFTLLRLVEAPRNGVARAKVLTRFETAFPPAAWVAGYRCLRLPAVDAPVKVRLVSDDPAGGANTAASLIQVRATDTDFGPAGRGSFDFRDGLYRSQQPLKKVACITVAVGATRSEKFPVPVFGGDDPVTLRFSLQAGDDERVRFERACLDLQKRVADARVAQAACFDAVARLIEGRKNAEALVRAKGGHAAVEAEEKAVTDDLKELQGQVEKSPSAGTLLAALERQLAPLREAQTRLGERVAELDAVVAKSQNTANLPQQVEAEAITTRIRLLLTNGDVDEALSAYDQLAALVPDDAAVKDRREKLRAEWKPKDAAHASARAYIYKVWPAVAAVPDFKESVPQVQAVVQTCIKAGDRHSLRKLLAHFNAAAVKLGDLVTPLDPNLDADRKQLADAGEVKQALEKVEQEVREFLKTGG